MAHPAPQPPDQSHPVNPQLARLHTVEDVMQRLSIGRSMAFELISCGRLRSVKVGRRRLISEAALVEFIEALDKGGNQ